jgi:hypothetical protein
MRKYMRRTLGLVVCFLLGMLSLSRIGEAPVASQVTPAAVGVPPVAASSAVEQPLDATPSVRIEHHLVHVPVTTISPVRTRSAPAVRQARMERRPDQSRASRARRVLFGDGTYRPEPFPRPTTRH